MIHIVRGAEPETLTLARDEHLARARLRGSRPTDKQLTGYQAARDLLAERQYFKCAYCEMTVRNEGEPVEHYRPKGRAEGLDWRRLRPVQGTRQHEAHKEDDARFAKGLPPLPAYFDRLIWVGGPGYWWLTWTWENTVFGCTGCNSGVKSTRFPQSRDAQVLAEHEIPPSGEHPLLLDPTASAPGDDPLEHIQFREVLGRWLPVPRGGSHRGAWTIALLRLDTSPGLLTAYDNRVRELKNVAALHKPQTRQGDAIQAAWTDLVTAVLAPQSPLLGLTWDWLDTQYPSSWRAQHGLSLARPRLQHPEAVETPPLPAIAEIPALQALPLPLADHIRIARNFQTRVSRPSVEQRPLPDLLAEIRALRPHATDAELASLLRRDPQTIRRHRPPP